MTKTSKLTYVEMPSGIFTSDGIWYHTSVKDLLEFAPKIIDKIGLETLFQKAGDWSRIPVTITIWTLPCLMLIAEPWESAVGSVLIYLIMAVLSPSVVIFWLIPIIRFMNHVVVQGLLYVMVLSFFASSGQFDALGIGLIGFVFLRWQVIKALTSYFVRILSRSISQIPTHDQILRNVLVSASQKYGAPLPELDRMEKRIIEIMTYRRQKK